MSARRTVGGLARLAVGVALALGIAYAWATDPIEDPPLLGSDVAARTELDLARAAVRADGPAALRVGWGRHEITPALGTTTWGYSERRGKRTEAVADPLFARALALAAGDGEPFVFLSADICAWPGELTARVAGELAGRLARERIYFGATHTHNGPGGLGGGPAIRWLLGAPDERTRDTVIDGAVAAVGAALDALGPGSYRELHVDGSEFVVNRVVAGDGLDTQLSLLDFERSGARFALVVCDAHATCIPDDHVVTSGDYPGAVVRALRARGFDDALFLAGATGQAGPRTNQELGRRPSTEAAEDLGRRLAEHLAEAARRANEPRRAELHLTALRVPVALPPYRVRARGRYLAPGLVEWLLGQPPAARVHAVRLNDTVFMGHSFEFSAVIDARLSARAAERGARLVTTSFNGDHNFYVVPAVYYDGGYEARMTFFGGGLGAYLEWVSERVLERLLDDQS